MKLMGIVAEYNPFHNGHAYHIAKAKRQFNADAVIVVMSGSFVQRGEPAITDKFTRAKWAIGNGADIVIELPDVLSLSCAERFASGAVRILSGTGVVDAICFGSECGDIELLKQAAAERKDGSAVTAALGEGYSYPKALEVATGNALPPNDILGVEYIRAVNSFAPDMAVSVIKRIGSHYTDSDYTGEYSSATAIRGMLNDDDNKRALCQTLPSEVAADIALLMKKGAIANGMQSLSDIVLYRLRSMRIDEIAALPDIAEGLENLFAKYCAAVSTYDELLSKVKSKRYTMARLKRICMNAILSIDSQLQNAAAGSDEALYIRVLAIKRGGESLLAQIKQNAELPVVLRAKDRDNLPLLATKVEQASQRAHCVRAMGQTTDKTAIYDPSNRLIVR